MTQMRNFNPIAFMRNKFLKIATMLVISSVTVISGLAAGTGAVALSGHVPSAIATFKLQPSGDLPATNVMKLAIGLPLRNTNELSALLGQIYDPSSPNYHHFLTPEEFTARYGPTEQDYESVSNFAKANGLTILNTHSNRVILDVIGKVSDIENALHVKLRTYHHPAENRDFFAPDSEPSLSSGLPVLHISGLDNYLIPRSATYIKPVPAVRQGTGSGPGGGYIGTDFRNAYVPAAPQTGTGQSVGLLEFDSGFYQSDIAEYESQAGLPNVPVIPVLLDGYNGAPGAANDEVSLDIEMAISMAPNASAIYVFEGEITDDILEDMVANSQIKQFGASWGYTIDSTSEQLFQQFAVQGQSFFNCSGDGLAWVGTIFTPCDDPYVTVVGGTTLTMNGTGASYASEKVWNSGYQGQNSWNPDGYWGSSGGISTTYSIPSWQTNVSMASNQGSTKMRNVPDVALTADNIYVVYNGGAEGLFEGTSCATPLWAGYMALVNQQLAANGRSPLGFINPTIYNLAESANYNSYFHDITRGNNTWPGSPNQFFAAPGYDLCTGWGTPNGENLINALAAQNAGPIHLSPPPAPYGTTLSALTGSNPNGNWDLFVANDSPGDAGEITNGWSLTFTLADPVGYAADNYLTMSATSTPVPTNSYGTYTLTVTNYGPSTSSNVVVEDSLPSQNFILIAKNLTAGSLTNTPPFLTWNVGTLAASAGAQLTLTIQPLSSGSYLNTAIVHANTPDPNPDDDSAFATINSPGGTPAPQLTSVVSGGHGGNFQFLVGALPGETNVVQGTTNLLTGPWIPLFTNVGSFTFTNTYITNSTVFFRDVIQP
jgi:uncharacterized repeat protein (TIGR01451 family)